MGIKLTENDVAFRCNIVDIRDGVMHDFSAGHVASELSRVIMEELSRQADDDIEFYPGVSYRNIMVWRNYPFSEITESTPPHDIQGKGALEYLPRGKGSDRLASIMEKSQSVISSSPAVKIAVDSFKGTPTSVWLWGGGRKPSVETLQKRFGLNGFTISAVDLIHGLGRAAGLSPWPVEGATGYIDTNYTGKAEALLKGLKESDIVFLHVESPDESGHEGNLEHKLQAIEDFDKKVVGTVMDGISEFHEYSVMVLPDHPTPIHLRTHTADPVPFCMFSSQGWEDTPYNGYGGASFSEASAAETGLAIDEGYRLLELMIRRRL
jgi:2,3-bisphosphoglycerate-independent phosphoglycerate mutase